MRDGPNAEFSVDEPMANSSMLVLPRITTPAWRSRRVTVASYGGCQPSRMREPQVVGMSVVVNTSLSASGTPGQRPERLTGGPALVHRARRGPRRVRRHVQERVQLAVDRGDPGQVRVGDLDRGHLAGRDHRSQVSRGHPGQLTRGAVARHDQSSARMRGTRNRCCSTAGAWDSTTSTGRRGTCDVIPEDVDQRHGVGRRRDPLSGHFLDPGHGRDDLVELGREMVEFFVAESQPGQPGQVGHLRRG